MVLAKNDVYDLPSSSRDGVAREHPAGNGLDWTESDISSLSILGVTGSVGESTIDVISDHRDKYKIVALTANRNAARLAELAIEYQAEIAVVGDMAAYSELKSRLSGTGIEAAAGEAAVAEAAGRPADWVMAAIVGTAGLRPTMEAVKQGCRVALANKECLVTAGPLFMAAVAQTGTTLLPVDSEHSAAFQAIGNSSPESIERLVLTASGGPFRCASLDEMKAVTPAQALKHPNWTMGPKITVDSATLMNKGLELIEAYYLFPLGADQLDIVVHPQSIIHCLVEYVDGAVMAQMSCPDMRMPIAYSLTWPRRLNVPLERLDLVKIGTLNFEAPDELRFPCLRLARLAMERGDGACTVLNAANEVAVEAFLAEKIGFLQISTLVEQALEDADRSGMAHELHNLEEVLQLDAETRARTSAALHVL